MRSSLRPYVASLAVATSVRTQGVGLALMRAVEESARESYGTTITLEVEDTNDAALRLYSRLGYRVLRRDANARKLVGDVFFGRSEPVTKLWLEKDLET